MLILKSKILKPLLEASYFLTIDEIISTTQITKRTFFYQLSKLNHWLADDLNLEPVENIRHMGYFLPENTKKALNRTSVSLKPQLSIQARQNNIIFKIINEPDPVSLKTFADCYQVSKKTIISDLKTIQKVLPPNLKLKTSNQGHLISGPKVEQRSLIFQFFETIDLSQIETFDQNKIEKMLTDFEKATGNKLSNSSQELLKKYFSWYFKYISIADNRLSKIISQSNNILGIQWANKILSQTFQISSLPESNYLVNTIFQTQLNSANEDYGYKHEMNQIAEKIIHRFSNISGVEFNDQTLINHLATHLITAYYRINNQQPVNDLELKPIFHNYRQLIRLTDYAIDPFRSIVKYPISNAELALISLYFGGILENQVLPKNNEQALVLVVCGNGLGTSQILRQQLQKMYPNLLFKISFDNLSPDSQELQQAQLIISTMHLENNFSVPVVVVHPLPTDQDLYAINLQLTQLKLIPNNSSIEALLDIIDMYCKVNDYTGLRKSLSNYLDPIAKLKPLLHENYQPGLIELLDQRIQTQTTSLTLTEAIAMVNQPLFNDQITALQYADDIIDLIKNNGPYMMLNQNILLAHGKTNNHVLGTGFSILILEKPISLDHNNYLIDIIICFATINESAHLQGLSDLLKIVTNPTNVNQLRHSKNKQDILAILEI